MDKEYITKRKETLKTEFDENTQKIADLQARQNWLNGSWAELLEAEKESTTEEKKPKKETK